MLENGPDLHVNECQKIQYYRARSTEEKYFLLVWCICKLHYYIDVIHSLDWKSAVKHDGGV